MMNVVYAQNNKNDTTTYHGIKVIDKYRWLENLKDIHVKNWFIEKNAKYDSFLLSKKNQKEVLKKVIEKFTIPSNIDFRKISQYGSEFFYIRTDTSTRNDLLIKKSNEKIDTIFYAKDTIHKYTIANYQFNKRNNSVLVCYYVDGSEVGKILVIDIISKKIIDSSVHNTFTLHPISWIPGKNEFVYTKLGEKRL
jgi:protease II